MVSAAGAHARPPTFAVERGCWNGLSSRDDVDRVAEFIACQRAQAPIKGRQHALSSVREREQVGIGQLLRALQPGGDALHSRWNLKGLGPEGMSGMGHIFLEEREGFRRRKSVLREGRIRGDADEAELRHGTGRPGRARTPAKPTVRDLMVLVRRPQQGREDIDVEERRLHGSSSRS